MIYCYLRSILTVLACLVVFELYNIQIIDRTLQGRARGTTLRDSGVRTKFSSLTARTCKSWSCGACCRHRAQRSASHSDCKQHHLSLTGRCLQHLQVLHIAFAVSVSRGNYLNAKKGRLSIRPFLKCFSLPRSLALLLFANCKYTSAEVHVKRGNVERSTARLIPRLILCGIPGVC